MEVMKKESGMVQQKFKISEKDTQLLEQILDEIQAAMDVFHALGESERLFLKHSEYQEGIRVHLTQVAVLLEALSESVQSEYAFVPWQTMKAFKTTLQAKEILKLILDELPQLHGDLNYLLWDVKNGNS